MRNKHLCRHEHINKITFMIWRAEKQKKNLPTCTQKKKKIIIIKSIKQKHGKLLCNVM